MRIKIKEAINNEADLLLKLRPLPEPEIFNFMDALRGGTYFNMGMYSTIPVSRAYKNSFRIYKVIDLAAIVSGVSYENIGTTKDFRDQTDKAAGHSWYDHKLGYENKVGVKRSDPTSKYVLWDVKQGTKTVVRYYIIDIAADTAIPASKEDILASDYLTDSEKKKLMPRPVTGFDKQTGEIIENKTVWRTAAFDHIFWLSQSGKEFGTRFVEALNLREDMRNDDDIFMDAHADCPLGTVDAVLSGEYAGLEKFPIKDVVEEDLDVQLDEDVYDPEEDIFMDAHADVPLGTVDAVLSGKYRADADPRYTPLVDNDLFTDFE